MDRYGYRRFTPISLLLIAAPALAAPPPAAPADEARRLDTVTSEGKPWMFNIDTKRAHLLPEVDGTTELCGDVEGLRVGDLVRAVVVDAEGVDLVAEVTDAGWTR